MGTVITNLTQGLIGILDDRRTLIRTGRLDTITPVTDHIRIGDDHFSGLLTAKIRELFQHLICGMQKQRRLHVGVVKSLITHNNSTIDLILRIQKVHITGSANRLIEFHSQLYDTTVQIPQILFRLQLVLAAAFLIPQIKGVVTDRLDFQIVIEIHDTGHFGVGLTKQNSLEQLSCLTGGTDNQALPVFLNETLRNLRLTSEIFQMGRTHQSVQVNSSDIILRQNNNMVWALLTDTFLIHTGLFV